MGLLLSCNKCTASGTESVITFSERLIDRLTVGCYEDDEEYTEKMIEQEWYDRIKCIDDSHSSAYGLSKDSFNSLVKQLEIKFKRMAEMETNCNKEIIVKCLHRHPQCPLKCNQEIKDYEECIDAVRLRQIKKRMKEIQKEREQNQL